MKIIGLDIGTTSICGICCDTDNGEIIKSVTLPNNSFIKTDSSYQKIQDPKIIIETVLDVYKELVTLFPDAVSVGITGQMHGIVYLDQKGDPISPLFTWQDGSGDLIYKNNQTYAEFLSNLSGYRLATGYGCVTLFYHTVNGKVPENAASFCTIHDLAAMALTGIKSPLIHISDAASFGLFDLKSLQFDKNAIIKAGLDIKLFPKITDEYEVIGQTAEGISVSAAIGDNQASVLGSVNSLDKSLLINVGTGSQISVIANNPTSASGIECRPLFKDKYLWVGSSLCGGRAYAILEKFLRETAELVTGKKVETAYSVMDKLMEEFDSSSNTLKAKTTFSGTRDNPKERGSITGVSFENLNMANLCDSFLNGIVDELYSLYEIIAQNLNKSPFIIVASGNGIRQNKALIKRFENKFGKKVIIPKQKEEASFGAALYGMTSAGYVDSIANAQEIIKY